MRKLWVGVRRRIGGLGLSFCGLLLLYLLVVLTFPGSVLVPVLQFLLLLLGLWLALRLTRRGMRQAIWRLRNRLLVTYLFIAVVPVFLIMLLAAIGGYALFGQLAAYLAMADLDRRVRTLQDITEVLAASDQPMQPDGLRRVAQIHRRRFPALRLMARNKTLLYWPPDQNPITVPDGWKEAHGVAVRDGQYVLWSRTVAGKNEAIAMMPLSRAYLGTMVPGLGDLSLLEIADRNSATTTVQTADGKITYVKGSHEPPAQPLPAPSNRFDVDIQWFSTVPIAYWNTPGKREVTLLRVHTRPSAVLRTIFAAGVEQLGDFIPILFLSIAVLFLLVEVGALVIGSSLTRTITRAVHNLYEGTQRVIEGDFGHRISVHGRDQLADLSTSFNTMTENLERLLAVAKEKERLQAEVEIARQVQEQLYPKVIPASQTIRLAATCRPARMVSGDYYDYLCLPGGSLAMAIGDVAGKGISAALLMATIQAALRMELRSGHTLHSTTGQLVSELNKQLYATTSPEKYATFFLGLYDEQTGAIAYSNAGHLPPLLIHGGEAIRLEVSGTVVGAFPNASYTDDQVRMERGDLLVCYTDGITEPENEYGEEFGEQRLVDLLVKNADKDESVIMNMILSAVESWSKSGTGAVEQPDDMTLLLARRL